MEKTFNYHKSLAGIILAGISTLCAQYCIQPVIKSVAAAFGKGAEGAGIIMSAGMIGMAIMLLLLVYISDKLPIKKLIVASIVIASATTIAVMIISNFTLLLITRAIQGAVLAVVPVLAIAYGRNNLPSEYVAYGASMYVMGTTLGGMTGRLFIGISADLVGWRNGMLYLGFLLLLIALAECWLLDSDNGKTAAKGDKKADANESIFCKENLPLAAVCLMGFTFSDCYIATFNYIPYVFSAAPYNFSHSIIGFIYLIQIFGAFGSFVTGKMLKKHGAFQICMLCFVTMLLGIGLSMTVNIIPKFLGLAMLTFGFFGAHGVMSGLSGKVAVKKKTGAAAAYMFCYYLGMSSMTALSGFLYRAFAWYGIVGLIVTEVVLSIVILTAVKKYVEQGN